ncbi:MAG: streptothricin acetyltransferase [Akkermansiaceae bacterium]|nr:streptothricin acetyltransferase [Akkermansiaceae bacterium]
MQINRVPHITAPELEDADFSFEVTEEARPPFESFKRSTIVPVEPFQKRYPIDLGQMTVSEPGQSMIATARDGRRVIGYITVSRAWNNCAQVDEFAVDRAFRRDGIGRLLMGEAIEWATGLKLPVLRLETQSNNVPACRFYEKVGFHLGGFDRELDSAIDGPQSNEVALFWYLRLKRS